MLSERLKDRFSNLLLERGSPSSLHVEGLLVGLLDQPSRRADNNHRDSLDIMADILNACGNRARKTHLMYQCNMSFRQLKYYLAFLLNKELLCEIDQTGNSGNGGFEVTDKGRRYLKAYKSLVSLMG